MNLAMYIDHQSAIVVNAKEIERERESLEIYMTEHLVTTSGASIARR